jgi:uncharacterized membrane protein YgdD (TMEM256/DUF423 family)
MHKSFLKTAALLGALSIAMGAFAAHTLRDMVSAYALQIFETGVRYQFYHVFALFFTGLLFKEFPNKLIRWSGYLFIAGIILFSGSLYILAIIKGVVIPGYDWVGAITPLGGISFIAGWVCLFLGITSK